jgi:hypothetical protein
MKSLTLYNFYTYYVLNYIYYETDLRDSIILYRLMSHLLLMIIPSTHCRCPNFQGHLGVVR